MSLLNVTTNTDQIGDAELYQTRRNMCIDPLKNSDLASHPLVANGTLINDIKKPSLRLSSLGHRNLINYPVPENTKPEKKKGSVSKTEICFYCDADPKRGATLCEPCERYFCGKHSAKHRHNCKEKNKKIISTTTVKPMSLTNPEKDIKMEPAPSVSSEDNNNNDIEEEEEEDVVIVAPKIHEDANDVSMESEEENEISSSEEEEEKENFKGREVTRLLEYTEQLQFDKDQCDFQRKVRNHNHRTGYKSKSLEEAAERRKEEAEAFIKFREKRKKKRLRKEKKLNGKRPKRKCLKKINIKDPLKEYQDILTSHWDPDYNDDDSGMDSEEERIASHISVDLTRELSDHSSAEGEEEESDEENMANRCYDTKTGKSSKMPDEPEPDSEPEDGIPTKRKRKSSAGSSSTAINIPADLIVPPVALTMVLLGKALKPDKQGSCTETPWLPDKGKSVLTSVPRKILPNVEGISLSDLKKKSLRKRIEVALEHRLHRAGSAISRAKKKNVLIEEKIALAKERGKGLEKETLALIAQSKELICLSKKTPFNLAATDFIKYNVGWVLHASVKDASIIWAYAVVAVNTPEGSDIAYKLVVVPLGLLKQIFPARVPCFKTGIAVARSLMIDSNIGHHLSSELWMPHWESMHETSKTHKQGLGCLVTSWPTRNPVNGKRAKRYLPTMDSRLIWTHMKSNPYGSSNVKVSSLVDLAKPPKKKQKTSKLKTVIKKEKEKVRKEAATAAAPEAVEKIKPNRDVVAEVAAVKKVNTLELKTIHNLLELAEFDLTNVGMSNQQLCELTVDSHRIMSTSPQAIGLYLEANMTLKTNLKRKEPPPPLNSLKSDTMLAMGKVPEKGKTQIGEKIVPAGAQTVRASVMAQKHVRRLKAKAALEKRKGTHLPQRRPPEKDNSAEAAVLAAASVMEKPPPKKKVKKEHPAAKQQHHPVSKKQLETSLIEASFGQCRMDWWDPTEAYFADFCDPLIKALTIAQQKGDLAKLLLDRLQIQSGGLDDLLAKICKIIDSMNQQTTQTGARSSLLKILESCFGIKDAARGMICGLVLVQRAYGIQDPPAAEEKKEPVEGMDDFMLAMLGNGDIAETKDVSEHPAESKVTFTGAMLLTMHESIVESRVAKGVDRDQSMAFFEKCKAWIETDLCVHGKGGFGSSLLERARNGETDPVILSLIWLMLSHELIDDDDDDASKQT